MKTFFRYFAVVLACSSCSHADEIVVPADRATQAGNGFILDPFEAPGTIDDVYGAKNFAGPIEINGIAFRLDETAGGASLDTVIPRVTIRMSTYSGTYNSYLVGPGYNGNKGLDDTVVFDAAVHWTTTDLSGSGPNPFDLKVQFSKPFLYDPNKGNLLMDFATSGPFSSGIHPDTHGNGDTSFGWFGDKTPANLVTEFNVTPVPESSTYRLLLPGVLLFFAVKRKTV